MTCKDCLYYEACKLTIKQVEGIKVAALLDDDYWCNAFANSCTIYSDKAEWIHLPCKVGDRVFSIVIIGGEYSVVADRVHALRISTVGIYVRTNWYENEEVGYNVFLTQEEAEKALAERSKK